MKEHLVIKYKKTKGIKKYTKQIVKAIPVMKKKKKKKKLIKEEKSRILDRKCIKIVVKMLKVFAQVTSSRKIHNWLKEEMTEAEFVARFATPLIDLTLKSCNTKLTFKPGEQKLLLVKGYTDIVLTKDDARLPGPNIDGTIKNTELDVLFSLVEVSGSPKSPTENYSHCKGDRNKLAKNLKYLLKVLISMKGMSSFKSACKIKLFDLHIYYNQVYVYSLSMPMWDLFVFKLGFKFDIPIKPTFVSKLFWQNESCLIISQSFLLINDYESSSSSESDKSTFSSPRISPKRRKRHERD
ncbi:unnamed protein product [Mucor circinelloides]